MSIGSFERYPLLFGPSPVHRLERLSAHLGGAPVWAKREDCNSGIAYGGNKTRKLEYLVADALAGGCDTLVSIGGVQSNHTRQVAAVAARAGLNCVLIQESWVNWPDPVYDKVGNILLSRLAGADVRLVTAEFGIGIKKSWEQTLREIEESGGRPYAIPAGASDHPLGGLGFAGWAFELASQERELGVFFDTIVVCSVTGSTQAGMVAGFAALAASGGRPRRVIGIDASAKPAETRDQVTRIARHTARLIGAGRELGDEEIELDERYHAGTYGIPDDATLDAMRLAARTEGMITDPVLRGQVHGRADRPDQPPRNRLRLHSALRPPRWPARAQRLQRIVLLKLGAPAPQRVYAARAGRDLHLRRADHVARSPSSPGAAPPAASADAASGAVVCRGHRVGIRRFRRLPWRCALGAWRGRQAGMPVATIR